MLPGRSSEFTRDEILAALSNRWRLYTLHALKRHSNEQVPLRDLVDHVARWEHEKPIDQLSPQERRSVKESLREVHLPKLEEMGFITHDADRQTVALTESASTQAFYVRNISERRAQWAIYYLCVAGVSMLSLLGVSFGVYPLTRFSPWAVAVFFAMTFGVLALIHLYDNYYRMRLDARDKPPGVK